MLDSNFHESFVDLRLDVSVEHNVARGTEHQQVAAGLLALGHNVSLLPEADIVPAELAYAFRLGLHVSSHRTMYRLISIKTYSITSKFIDLATKTGRTTLPITCIIPDLIWIGVNFPMVLVSERKIVRPYSAFG